MKRTLLFLAAILLLVLMFAPSADGEAAMISASRLVDGFILLLAMLVLGGYVMAWLDDRRAAHNKEEEHGRAAHDKEDAHRRAA